MEKANELKVERQKILQSSSSRREKRLPKVDPDEDAQLQNIVSEAMSKAHELKEKKEKERAKPHHEQPKPKWGQRQTSWKPQDFDAVQDLVNNAWNHVDKVSPNKKRPPTTGVDLQDIEESPEVQ